MGKKKDKITYIDDGRTLADMSGVSSGLRLGNKAPFRPRPDAREVWKTYWSAVKMMIGPMLIVIVGMGIVYMVAYFLFTVM